MAQETPQEAQDTWKLSKKPIHWAMLGFALLPFIVATVYLSNKPKPERQPRTHGGSSAASSSAGR